MEEIYCFAGNPLDRVSQRRQDAGWVASLLDKPDTRVLPLHELKPRIRHSSAVGLDWQNVGPWRSLIDDGSTLILLGMRGEQAYFALDATPAEIPADSETATMDARTVAPMIDSGEAAILAEARSLIDWHARHRFCARCGNAERCRLRRLGAALPELQGASLSARRSCRHHACGQGRAVPARPGPAAAWRAILLPCGLHGAG